MRSRRFKRQFGGIDDGQAMFVVHQVRGLVRCSLKPFQFRQDAFGTSVALVIGQRFALVVQHVRDQPHDRRRELAGQNMQGDRNAIGQTRTAAHDDRRDGIGGAQHRVHHTEAFPAHLKRIAMAVEAFVMVENALRHRCRKPGEFLEKFFADAGMPDDGPPTHRDSGCGYRQEAPG